MLHFLNKFVNNSVMFRGFMGYPFVMYMCVSCAQFCVKLDNIFTLLGLWWLSPLSPLITAG